MMNMMMQGMPGQGNYPGMPNLMKGQTPADNSQNQGQEESVEDRIKRIRAKNNPQMNENQLNGRRVKGPMAGSSGMTPQNPSILQV